MYAYAPPLVAASHPLFHSAMPEPPLGLRKKYLVLKRWMHQQQPSLLPQRTVVHAGADVTVAGCCKVPKSQVRTRKAREAEDVNPWLARTHHHTAYSSDFCPCFDPRHRTMATPEPTENLAQFNAANATYAAGFKDGALPMPPARKVSPFLGMLFISPVATTFLSADSFPTTNAFCEKIASPILTSIHFPLTGRHPDLHGRAPAPQPLPGPGLR